MNIHHQAMAITDPWIKKVFAQHMCHVVGKPIADGILDQAIYGHKLNKESLDKAIQDAKKAMGADGFDGSWKKEQERFINEKVEEKLLGRIERDNRRIIDLQGDIKTTKENLKNAKELIKEYTRQETA